MPQDGAQTAPRSPKIAPGQAKMEPPTIDFIPRVFYENKNEELKPNKNIIQNSKPWNGYEKMKCNKLNIRIPKNSDNYLKKLYGKRWYIEQNFWFPKKNTSINSSKK